MMQGMFNTHPTRLSEATRDKIANVLAAVLIAIIVICVVLIVWTLIQDGAVRPSPRSTPTSTPTVPSGPMVYYRNCAEAHAAGRWDIPEGDPAYRPGLDKDHNGVACESRTTSRLAGG